jgi:hypothetical protein
MIARADRHLSPTARLIYAEISRLIESGRGFAPRSAPREPVPGAALQGI